MTKLAGVMLKAATKICPPNNIRVLQSETCPEVPSQPVAEEASNDTSTEEEPECEEGFVLENGVCGALDSNCGGVPCTASDKENSTTSDPIPGEPHTPTTDTDSEETEAEEDSEGEEEQSQDEQTEDQQPEQEEPSAEDSEQEN